MSIDRINSSDDLNENINGHCRTKYLNERKKVLDCLIILSLYFHPMNMFLVSRYTWNVQSISFYQKVDNSNGDML